MAIAGMPEATSIALRLREEGIYKLDSFLMQVCSARRLSSQEVGAYVGRSVDSGGRYHQTNLIQGDFRFCWISVCPICLLAFLPDGQGPAVSQRPISKRTARLCLDREQSS